MTFLIGAMQVQSLELKKQMCSKNGQVQLL